MLNRSSAAGVGLQRGIDGGKSAGFLESLSLGEWGVGHHALLAGIGAGSATEHGPARDRLETRFLASGLRREIWSVLNLQCCRHPSKPVES
jgi:hypothetical protein